MKISFFELESNRWLTWRRRRSGNDADSIFFISALISSGELRNSPKLWTEERCLTRSCRQHPFALIEVLAINYFIFSPHWDRDRRWPWRQQKVATAKSKTRAFSLNEFSKLTTQEPTDNQTGSWVKLIWCFLSHPNGADNLVNGEHYMCESRSWWHWNEIKFSSIKCLWCYRRGKIVSPPPLPPPQTTRVSIGAEIARYPLSSFYSLIVWFQII
jgi:hypothetical protein